MKLFGGFNFEKTNNQAESFDDFFKKEKNILNNASGFLLKLAPERIKKPAAGLLTAFALFAEASSAYAENAEKDEVKIEETEKSDSIFDLNKFIEKMEISTGGEIDNAESGRQEVVAAEDLSLDRSNKLAATEFYKNFSSEERQEAIVVFGDFYTFNSSQEFFNFLKENKDQLNDRQKAYLLQLLGSSLESTYNYDLLEKERVAVSDDAMYEAIRDYFNGNKDSRGGLCGNSSAFFVRAASSLGIEAWMQSGSLNKENHIWPGLILEGSSGKKEIVFYNYNDMITTGTLNYRDALGAAERYMGSVGVFNSFVGNGVEVKSKAQEKIEEAGGIKNTGEELENNLSGGEIKKEKNSLEIRISPDVKEIKLNKDYIFLSFHRLDDAYNDPYLSLRDMNAARAGLDLKGKNFELETNVAVLNMNLKDVNDGSAAQNELMGSVVANYVDGKRFNKDEYGKFILNWGATMQAAISSFFDKKINSYSYSTMGEGAVGLRLIYLNPNETKKFYIGVSEVFRAQADDFEDQNETVRVAESNLTLGSSIKVNEAVLANIEAALTEADWGNKFKIKIGLEGEELAGQMELEMADSEMERFIPSEEKIGASVKYEISPKYIIGVSGFKSEEKYKDADKIDAYGGEIKLIINLM